MRRLRGGAGVAGAPGGATDEAEGGIEGAMMGESERVEILVFADYL